MLVALDQVSYLGLALMMLISYYKVRTWNVERTFELYLYSFAHCKFFIFVCLEPRNEWFSVAIWCSGAKA